MRAKYLIIVAAAAAAAGSMGACSRSYEEAGDVAPASGLSLHVENNNFLDMDVYAVADGVATRVGTVTGNGKRDFTISGGYSNREFRVVATPIGGPGRASTGSLNVTGGQTIDFRIGTVLSQSSVIIR